jgi:hypothetical protein
VGKKVTSSIARLDFMSLMTEAVFPRFLRDGYCGIIEIKSITTGDLLTAICDAEHQESQDEEITNIGESRKHEVESAFSEDATYEIQDPAQSARSRAPKRKKG